MKNININIAAFVALFILWTYEAEQAGRPLRDTLEYISRGETTWNDFPGPYSLTLDNMEYKVDVEELKRTRSDCIFRVRRDWGTSQAIVNIPEIVVRP